MADEKPVDPILNKIGKWNGKTYGVGGPIPGNLHPESLQPEETEEEANDGTEQQ